MVETKIIFSFPICLIFSIHFLTLFTASTEAYRAFVLRESGRGAVAAHQTPFVKVCKGKGLKFLGRFLQPALVLSS